MNLKNIFKYFVPFVSVVLLASCSNTLQPMSVSDAKIDFSAVAVTEQPIRDMDFAGGQLWAVTKNPAVPSPSDYYLARWNYQTIGWELQYHYGLRLAVSSYGICYHINSSKQIWWVKPNGLSGNLSAPPGFYKRLVDIGTTIDFMNDGIDQIMVIVEFYDGRRELWRCDFDINQEIISVDWRINPDTYPSGEKPARVSCEKDFYWFVTVNTNGNLYLNDAHYDRMPGTYYVDAAVSAGDIIAVRSGYLWWGRHDVPMQHTNIQAKASVEMLRYDGISYVLWIDQNDHANIWTLDDVKSHLY